MTSLYFMGDSHLSCVLRAAKRSNIESTLGPTMDGGGWARGHFYFRKDGVIRLYGNELLRLAGPSFSNLSEVEAPIVTTIGFHTAYAISTICRLGDTSRSFKSFYSRAVIAECAQDMRRKHLDLLRTLVEMGKSVVAFPPPPRHDREVREMAQQFDEFMLDQYGQAGISVIDPREFSLDDNGEFLAEYLPERDDDIHHGNFSYGRALLERVLASVPNEMAGFRRE